MPRGFGILVYYLVSVSNEEWSFHDAIDHHDKALNCEETRIVFFCEVKQGIKFFDVLFKFLFDFIYVLLLLIKILVVYVFL